MIIFLDTADIDEIRQMVQSEAVPEQLRTKESDPYYGEKRVLLRRQSKNARITIFDGGHEIIPNAALHWLQQQVKK